MATVVVLYDYKTDAESVAVMDEVRPAHRKFLGSQPNLLLSGPTGDSGAVLVFEGEAGEVEQLLDDDPFADAEVIARRRVTTWDVVLGSLKDQLPG